MITIESPSMALNDSRSNRTCRMDVNRTTTAATAISTMVDWILAAARRAAGGQLKNLVLNGHGAPGSLLIGAGLSRSTMAPFGRVSGKVAKIWFRGCLVARIAGSGTAAHGDGAYLRRYGLNSGDGHTFVSEFARLTGCYVVAPTEMQSSNYRNPTAMPAGQLDTYEGLLLCYDPHGAISWRRRYPSLHHYNLTTGTAQLPPHSE
jgi:hypothetical protein